jgi:hypothetical protein
MEKLGKALWFLMLLAFLVRGFVMTKSSVIDLFWIALIFMFGLQQFLKGGYKWDARTFPTVPRTKKTIWLITVTSVLLLFAWILTVHFNL